MIIHTPSAEMMQELADAIVRLRNEQVALHHGLRSMRRHWQAAGSSRQERGKPDVDMAPGAVETVNLYDSSGNPTGATKQALNPYAITIPSIEYVRLISVIGWAELFAVPDELTECDELAPHLVAPLIGS